MRRQWISLVYLYFAQMFDLFSFSAPNRLIFISRFNARIKFCHFCNNFFAINTAMSTRKYNTKITSFFGKKMKFHEGMRWSNCFWRFLINQCNICLTYKDGLCDEYFNKFYTFQ